MKLPGFLANIRRSGGKHAGEESSRPSDERASSRLRLQNDPTRATPTQRRALRGQLRFLVPLLIFSLLLSFVFLWLDYRRTVVHADLNEISGEALMHSQRLGKAAPGAMAGVAEAFAQLGDSRNAMKRAIAALRGAQESALSRLVALPESLPEDLGALELYWSRTEAATGVLTAQRELLSSVGQMRKAVNDSNDAMLTAARRLAGQRLVGKINPRETAASTELMMLTQKIAKDVNQLVNETSSSELARSLSTEVALFRELVDGLISGNDKLGLSGTVDAESRKALAELKAQLALIDEPLERIVEQIARIQDARRAGQLIMQDSEKLRVQLLAMKSRLRQMHEASGWTLWLFTLFATLAALAGLAMFRSYLNDTRVRAIQAEHQQREAERLEQEATRVNEQNQAAILRLMNELQDVADGDLTVQPTVTEDITGAIADSVGYTLEELRGIVTRINSTAEQVNHASSRAQQISQRLQLAAEQQSREIRATGEAVLRMASQIDDVSTQATESANVARRSLAASESGAAAVQNAIAGMNGIRDQIQETAKRIKRLGESSQEVGEIVELISDITEQTNVLALNAAIQAASAGEAGRGFTVVAEEVQRLAERSAEATRQIAGLIRAIQTDTQDAIAAMERSTQGVVAGTRLSDEAGNALEEIGSVSRQLAELIEGFAATASEQADSAGGVAHSIQRMLIVTEQTGKGTMLTASSIAKLSELGAELKASVSRFKVA